VIPAELTWLFWDVDPSAIDLARDHDYVDPITPSLPL
jgi:hypothetical protein